jgi:hypothetical protein
VFDDHDVVTKAWQNRQQQDWRTQLSRISSSTLQGNFQCGNSGSQIVTMMQTAEPWHRYNFATYAGVAHCFTTGRRSLHH